MSNDPLQLPLRDIHLPDSVSWWPPAPGWWTVLALFIAAVGLGLWLRRRRIQKQRSAKLLSLRHLQTMRNAFAEHGDCQRLTQELSALLRRATISVYDREDTASLTGEAWLKFLDKNLGDRRFSQGPGRLLMEAPYQRRPSGDVSDLLRLCEAWIRSLPDKPAGGRA